MSEVRTCDECEAQAYANQPGAAAMRTIETEHDDGTITSEERHLCGRCYQKVNNE